MSDLTQEELLELFQRKEFSLLSKCTMRNRKFWRQSYAQVVKDANSIDELGEDTRKFYAEILTQGLKRSNLLGGVLCDVLGRAGYFNLVEAVVAQLLERHPNSTVGRLQLSKILFRLGRLKEAREELSMLLPIKNKWVAREFLKLAMAFNAWDSLEIGVPQIEALNEPDLLGSMLVKAKASLSLPREVSADNEVPVICINLDRDESRYLGLSSLYKEKGFKISRHSAVLGSSIPEAAQKKLAKETMPTGTLGCFLSHVAVWEAVASGDDPVALVIEDDALPVFDFDLNELVSNLPDEFDVCFVNDRAVGQWDSKLSAPYAVTPLAESWLQLDKDIGAVGGDGYMLSKKGAGNLIEIFQDAGLISFDVDWWLYAIALGEQSYDEDARLDSILLSVLKRLDSNVRLSGYSSAVPFVRHSPLGFSARLATSVQLGLNQM